MNIYIPNIKLPKDEPGAFQVIVMYVGADGKLRAECEGTHVVTAVPPHGRLIDADKLADSFDPSDFWNPDAEDNCFAAVRIVHSASTIIPASEEG